MMPVTVLVPAIPPICRVPLTVPLKVQLLTVPAFSPARPPTTARLPPGCTEPSTCRSCTRASCRRYRNNPCTLPSSVRFSPRMVCPCPSSAPPKVGIPAKSLPVRSISSVTTTVRPTLQLSRRQSLAKASSCSAVAIWMVSGVVSSARTAGASSPASRHRLSTAARRRSY